MAPIISATMAPNDQMSIGVEYLAQPSKISGALAREESQCLNQRGKEKEKSEASSPVPQGDHLVSVNPDRNSKGTGKSKISNFDHL